MKDLFGALLSKNNNNNKKSNHKTGKPEAASCISVPLSLETFDW